MPSTNPAMRTQPNIAMHPTIKATGKKGFVAWLATDPALSTTLYPKIKSQIATLNAQSAGVSGLGGIGRFRGLRGAYSEDIYGFGVPGAPFGRLGDDSTDITPDLSLDTSSVDLSSSIPTITSSPAPINLSSDPTVAATPASAASPAWSSAMASIITAVGTGVTAANAATINSQLAQAAANRPPLALSALPIPGTLSSSTTMILLLGGVAVVGVLAMSSRKK